MDVVGTVGKISAFNHKDPSSIPGFAYICATFFFV